ncbi:MAG: hypothetical protein AB1454_03355 [Candidatus Auribacterota bacterium]
MSKGIFVLVFCVSLIGSLLVVNAQDNDGSHVNYDREVYYTDDGVIDYVNLKYDDGVTVKKIFDEFGRVVEKHVNDELSVTYEYSVVDGVKSSMETEQATGATVKRVFNNRGEIISSEYPDYSETYEYQYDSVGDVSLIMVTGSDGETKELNPKDPSLSFLNDYGVLDTEEADIATDLHEREYLFNPTKFRDKMMQRKNNVNR